MRARVRVRVPVPVRVPVRGRVRLRVRGRVRARAHGCVCVCVWVCTSVAADKISLSDHPSRLSYRSASPSCSNSSQATEVHLPVVLTHPSSERIPRPG